MQNSPSNVKAPSASKNVIFASRIFQPERAAAAFRLSAVADALVTAACRVTVLTTSLPKEETEGASGRDAAESKLTVRRWPVLRDKTGYVRGYLPYMSFDLPLFFRLLAAKQADVILVEPPPTTGAVVRAAAAVRRIPYVWYAADIWSDATKIAGAPAAVVGVVGALERFAIRGAQGVIAVSEGVAERVLKLGGKNVRVIPNGIDTGVYHPDVQPPTATELELFGITGRYMMYAGTASEWQGASIFAKAVNRVIEKNPDLQVVFVGQGSEWELIERLAAEYRATFGREIIVQLPSISPEVVASLLAGADAALVSIVPDKGYDFAYPTKVLAALAVGTPVLYAGKGPVARDLEAKGLGQVANYDEDDVAQKMTAMAGAARDDKAISTRHLWVRENRSMKAMGQSAAAFVLGNAIPQ